MREWTAIGLSFAFGCLAAIDAGGQNLLKNGDAESGFENWENVSIQKDSPKSGGACFQMKSPNSAFGVELIPVDTSRSHTLSGWFKNPGGEPFKNIYFSIMPFDSQKKQIKSHEVNTFHLKSRTTLAAPCREEDVVLKIEDGTNWRSGKYDCAAFDADETDGFGDLPNHNTTALGIKRVENKNGLWEVELYSKCGLNRPAGTRVREHSAASTYMYPVIIKDLSAADGWKRFEGKVQGMGGMGVPANQFWKGAAFVRIGVVSNDPGTLLFDDIKFEETK